MSIAKPFTFVANTYAKASEVNADFDTVYSQVNSNISAIAQNATDIDNLENNKADINGNTAQRFAVADAVTNNDAINKQYLLGAINNSIDYISGFLITKDSGSPNDTIIVSEGSCYDSTKTVILKKNNSSTKQNENQAANVTYHVYVIGNSSGSLVDILISTNSSVPGLPSGYSLYRRIGYFITDDNNNISSITQLSGSAVFSIINVMPDYSRKWEADADTWYNADKNYWLHLQTDAIDDKNDPYLEVQYNNVTEKFQSAGSTTASEHFYFCVTSVVPRGGRFKFYAGNSGAVLSVIPCIGE